MIRASLALVALTIGCRSHMPSSPTRNALSVSLPAAITRTAAGAYERQLETLPAFSVATGAGFRFGGFGDYASQTVAVSSEGRYWITGAPLVRSVYARQMSGFFAGFRLSGARTATVHRERAEVIGVTWEMSETITAGYRVILYRHLELTASQGLQARHEFESRNVLPSWSRFGFTFGATIGAVF